MILLHFIAILIFFIMQNYALGSQQSNYNILPSPISYPYFEANRLDLKVEGSFINMTSSTNNFTLSGGLGDLKGRYSFNKYIAFDGEFGLAGFSGTMTGISPITPTYTSSRVPYLYRVDGDAQLSMFLYRMSGNLEIQILHTESFGAILFAGPNFTYTNLTISTPFSLVVPSGYSNAGQVYSGYTDKLTIESSLSGFQFGLQLDSNVPNSGIRFSPFMLTSTFSGNATITDNPGTSNSQNTTLTASIPSSSVTTYGIDIVYNDFSIGSALQQISSSQQQSNGNLNIFCLSISYRFSSDFNNSGNNSTNNNIEKNNIKDAQ